MRCITHSTHSKHLKRETQTTQHNFFDFGFVFSVERYFYHPVEPRINMICEQTFQRILRSSSVNIKKNIICQSQAGLAYPLFRYKASSAIRICGWLYKCVVLHFVACHQGSSWRAAQCHTRAWLNDFIYTNSVTGMTFPLNTKPFRTIYYFIIVVENKIIHSSVRCWARCARLMVVHFVFCILFIACVGTSARSQSKLMSLILFCSLWLKSNKTFDSPNSTQSTLFLSRTYAFAQSHAVIHRAAVERKIRCSDLLKWNTRILLACENSDDL